MENDRLITIAIHTYEKAVILKSLLESEGIHVALHNVNLIQPVISSGVRVRIHEKDLPLALRIIENAEIITPPGRQSAGEPIATIVVPVDFSPHATEACKMAFRLADTLGASLELIHTFIDPYFSSGFQLTETVNYDITENAMRQQLEEDASRRMKNFCDSLREGIKGALLPAVKFSSEVMEGVVGSVTAEVLDSCRVPVFTVPEHVDFERLTNIALYASLDQSDLLVLDTLHRLLPGRTLTVTFIALPSKKISDPGKPMQQLLQYGETQYSADSFRSRIISSDELLDESAVPPMENIYDMVVVPNRKKNIFARLFNPGIAHRLLFHADIPILAIPV